MFFIITDRFLFISQINTNNESIELYLYDLKSETKSQLSVNLSQIENKNKNEEKINSNANEKLDYSIICGNFSQNCEYLAICDNRRQLFVFQYNQNNWTQIFKTNVSRNCIKLLFASNKNSVICGHKSGDVYEYDFDKCNNESIGGRLLLGHCSMLLDVIQTNDNKYLITCDRDEKIRVSSYPNTYTIQSYCLGHKEFVSSITTINDTIVSGSGDGSIRLWNPIDGKQINVFMCDSNETIEDNAIKGTKFAVKKLVTNRKTDPNFLSISFYKQSMVKIYLIESLSLRLIHNLDLDEEPIDMLFDVSNSHILWLLLPKTKTPLNSFQISLENITKANIYEKIIEEINCDKDFQNNLNSNTSTGSAHQLEGLYKHWFNNVEIYFENKQKRENEMKVKKFRRF